MKCVLKYKTFLCGKCMRKYRLQSVGHFVMVSVCQERPGTHLNIKMASYRHRNTHCWDKTVSMLTSSNRNILCVTVPGEFPAQRPVTRSFDVFFDLRLNKRLRKQSWGWWFETLSHPLWRHYDRLYIETGPCLFQPWCVKFRGVSNSGCESLPQ